MSPRGSDPSPTRLRGPESQTRTCVRSPDVLTPPVRAGFSRTDLALSPAEGEVGASAAKGHEVDAGRGRLGFDSADLPEPLEDTGLVVGSEVDKFLTALAGEGEDAPHIEAPAVEVVEVIEELGPGSGILVRRELDFTNDGGFDEVDADEAVKVEFPVGLAGIGRPVEKAAEGDEVGGRFHRDLMGEPPEFPAADVKVVNLGTLSLKSFKFFNEMAKAFHFCSRL